MIAFISNVQNRQIDRYRKYISDCQGWRREVKRSDFLLVWVFFLGDEKILELVVIIA